VAHDLAIAQLQHGHRDMFAGLVKTRVIPTFCAITPERIGVLPVLSVR
jgi:hypothetical protein